MHTDDERTRALAIRDRMIRDDAFDAVEVLQWMESGSMELMSAAFQILSSRTSQLRGTLSSAAVAEFEARYLIQIMAAAEPPSAVFDFSPYLAGHALATLYKTLRNAQKFNPLALWIRNELEGLYQSGDEAKKRLVVDGVLEHIFESADLRGDFAAWRGNPALRTAFDEASDWCRGSKT